MRRRDSLQTQESDSPANTEYEIEKICGHYLERGRKFYQYVQILTTSFLFCVSIQYTMERIFGAFLGGKKLDLIQSNYKLDVQPAANIRVLLLFCDSR